MRGAQHSPREGKYFGREAQHSRRERNYFVREPQHSPREGKYFVREAQHSAREGKYFVREAQHFLRGAQYFLFRPVERPILGGMWLKSDSGRRYFTSPGDLQAIVRQHPHNTGQVALHLYKNKTGEALSSYEANTNIFSFDFQRHSKAFCSIVRCRTTFNYLEHIMVRYICYIQGVQRIE